MKKTAIVLFVLAVLAGLGSDVYRFGVSQTVSNFGTAVGCIMSIDYRCATLVAAVEIGDALRVE